MPDISSNVIGLALRAVFVCGQLGTTGDDQATELLRRRTISSLDRSTVTA